MQDRHHAGQHLQAGQRRHRLALGTLTYEACSRPRTARPRPDHRRSASAATRSRAPSSSTCWRCSSPTRDQVDHHDRRDRRLGEAEEDAAQFIADEAKRGRKKPMVGFIAGRTALRPPHGPCRRDHLRRQGRRESKIAAMEAAGIRVSPPGALGTTWRSVEGLIRIWRVPRARGGLSADPGPAGAPGAGVSRAGIGSLRASDAGRRRRRQASAECISLDTSFLYGGNAPSSKTSGPLRRRPAAVDETGGFRGLGGRRAPKPRAPRNRATANWPSRRRPIRPPAPRRQLAAGKASLGDKIEALLLQSPPWPGRPRPRPTRQARRRSTSVAPDDDPRLSHARPSRRQSRSARLGRRHGSLPSSTRSPTASPTADTTADLPRQRARPGIRDHARDRRDPARTYCGNHRLGVEFMHMTDPDQKRWIQERIEGRRQGNPSPRGKKAILNKADRGRGASSSSRRQVHRHQALRPRRRRNR